MFAVNVISCDEIGNKEFWIIRFMALSFNAFDGLMVKFSGPRGAAVFGSATRLCKRADKSVTPAGGWFCGAAIGSLWEGSDGLRFGIGW